MSPRHVSKFPLQTLASSFPKRNPIYTHGKPSDITPSRPKIRIVPTPRVYLIPVDRTVRVPFPKCIPGSRVPLHASPMHAHSRRCVDSDEENGATPSVATGWDHRRSPLRVPSAVSWTWPRSRAWREKTRGGKERREDEGREPLLSR